MIDPETKENFLRLRRLLTEEELKVIKAECADVTEWLLSRNECTCVEVLGEDPACRQCQATELIELLFDLIDR